MTLDKLLDNFEKMTRGYEKLTGEEIPAGYYSACAAAIQEAYEQGLLAKRQIAPRLRRIIASIPITKGLADGEKIREELMKVVKDLEKQ